MSEWKPESLRPVPYLLVELALETGKHVPGWWTGTAWDGRRLKDGVAVLGYRKIEGQCNNTKNQASPFKKAVY